MKTAEKKKKRREATGKHPDRRTGSDVELEIAGDVVPERPQRASENPLRHRRVAMERDRALGAHEITVKGVREDVELGGSLGASVGVLYLPVLITGEAGRALSEFEDALSECVAAASEAHAHMERNRAEIERLGAETRELLSRLKAA